MPEAVWFAAPRHVEIREEPSAPLGRDAVRIRSIVSGISAGSELLVYAGRAPAGLEPDLPTTDGDFGLPMKFGYASVGCIVGVGADVEGFATGDLVFAYHPHQTEFVVPADFAVPLPSQLPSDIGVFTANLETAVTMVLDAHPRLGEAVLIVGQGVVGLLVTMLLHDIGVRPIITVDLHQRRRDASKEAGADHALAGEGVAGRVGELTGGRGVDVAIELSGSHGGLQSCIDAVAFGGTVIVGSWYGSREVPLLLGGAFHRRRVRMLSSQVSTLDPSLGPRWDRARRTRLVSELLSRLPLGGLVTHRFAFRDAASAYELLEHSPGECLQVVLAHV